MLHDRCTPLPRVSSLLFLCKICLHQVWLTCSRENRRRGVGQRIRPTEFLPCSHWHHGPAPLPHPYLLQAVAMDALSLEQQLPYAFFTQAGSQQPPPQPQPPPPPPPVPQQQPPPPQVSVGLPQGGPLLPSASLTRGPQLPPLSVTVPSTLPQSPTENPGQPPMGIDATSVSLRGVPGPSVCVYP